jgi:hypothetical protein
MLFLRVGRSGSWAPIDPPWLTDRWTAHKQPRLNIVDHGWTSSTTVDLQSISLITVDHRQSKSTSNAVLVAKWLSDKIGWQWSATQSRQSRLIFVNLHQSKSILIDHVLFIIQEMFDPWIKVDRGRSWLIVAGRLLLIMVDRSVDCCRSIGQPHSIDRHSAARMTYHLI